MDQMSNSHDPFDPSFLADNLKINLGMMLESNKNIPDFFNFYHMVKTGNENFHSYLQKTMQGAVLAQISDGDFEGYSNIDFSSVVLDKSLIDDVYEQLYPMTKKDFVDFKNRLFAEVVF